MEFVNIYIQAIRENKIDNFNESYRNIDILLVDDIQLLEGKPGTQEEFFKVFDYLHETNPICKKKKITEIPLSILDSLSPLDIEEYLFYLKYYDKCVILCKNLLTRYTLLCIIKMLKKLIKKLKKKEFLKFLMKI